ncbi:N-glycosylase/DNA lyase [Magnaporthiopsis poae ATCC 64411]|uniref:N-glycosylase/DNA lyase n=1 Tax=Magnaporthiopsis poae (strain ATCC 64411 / 73-15) TaxID=644358 RepID=A0A0C4EG45_MAGP6|nr:N-glycosylase/DNA lyase [Magnaporthiopsis poae ATCC 64411]
MAPTDVLLWRKLPVSLAELCIDTTLRCGQSFRWLKIQDEWHCSLHGRVISLKQDETHLHYRATWPASRRPKLSPGPPSPKAVRDEQKQDDETESVATAPPQGTTDDTEQLLLRYFNMSHSLASLYSEWSGKDANFRSKAPKFTGVRILNQDAWETSATTTVASLSPPSPATSSATSRLPPPSPSRVLRRTCAGLASATAPDTSPRLHT